MNVSWLWISQKSFSFVCRAHTHIYISVSTLIQLFLPGFPARLIVISIYYNIIKFLTNSAVIFFNFIQFEKATNCKRLCAFATYLYYIILHWFLFFNFHRCITLSLYIWYVFSKLILSNISCQIHKTW